MNLLLDTHLLLWAAGDDARLSPRARAMIADMGNTLWFSVASLWEVAIKQALNRSDFQVDAALLRDGLLANGYRELAVEGHHCIALTRLPAHHADPFDRMLLSQAIADNLRLLTADRILAGYEGPVERV